MSEARSGRGTNVATRRRRRWPWLAAALAALPLGLGLRFGGCFDALAPERLERPGPAVVARAPEARRVVLVSIDGLAPRLIDPEHTPELARLAREGLSARRAETTLPSTTLPSHTSMLAGVPPAVHGVDWNRYQPWSRIRVPTLFDVCAAEGLRCGLFAGKVKFAHFAEASRGVERWVFTPDAADVLAEAERYIRERDPDFCFVHLAEVDLAGHAEGWGSEAQRAALARIDRLLAGFVPAVEAAGSGRLALLVTADHGGHRRTHGTAEEADVRIPWILWGPGIAPQTLEETVSTLDTAPTILALLGRPVPPGWAGVARWPPPARAAAR